MPNPVLLLRLEGPLQSWGVRSRWDVRDTGSEPTKSGIVGLLGCALGYPMNDTRLETEVDAGLLFGVRVENQGRVMRDFQTITDFLPTSGGGFKHGGGTATSLEGLRKNPESEPATILSPRFYLEDASFLVALSAKEGYSGLLQKCAEALEKPFWPLFLGRKACVATRPIFEEYSMVKYEDLRDALTRHPWSYLGACGKPRKPIASSGNLTAFIESEAGKLTRQDAMRINAARVYGFRTVEEFRVPKDVVAPEPLNDVREADR